MKSSTSIIQFEIEFALYILTTFVSSQLRFKNTPKVCISGNSANSSRIVTFEQAACKFQNFTEMSTTPRIETNFTVTTFESEL